MVFVCRIVLLDIYWSFVYRFFLKYLCLLFRDINIDLNFKNIILKIWMDIVI